MGSYVLGVEVIYPNGIAVASSQFRIEDKAVTSFLLVGLILAGLVIIIYLIVKIKMAGGLKNFILKNILRRAE